MSWSGAEGKMMVKRSLVAVLAMLLGASACVRGSDTVTVPSASPPPAPTATVERLDYYPEGNERPFRFQLLDSNEQPLAIYPGPSRIVATYREQVPYRGDFDGTAFVFGVDGAGDAVSLAIPAGYVGRVHLLPGTTYQIIAQTIVNWPDTFGLIIKQGEELIFQGISDWRLDASMTFACLSPVRVEQVGILLQRYREGEQCYGRFTNTQIQFSLGRDAATLHQGQSATIEDYEISLEVARIVDRFYCPDAGAINVSYTVAKSSLREHGASESAVETLTPGLATAGEVTVPDANLEGYLRRLTNKDTGPLLGSDLERLRCFVRLYPVGWNWESAPNHGRITSLRGLEHATSLEAIYLDGSGISDLSPLGNLEQLTQLRVDHNELAALSPLQGLTSLTQLWVGNNRVSDLAPLSSLTRLSHLNLDDNSITDISPVSSLVNLAELSLYQNQITDVSPLSSLVNLKQLRLDSNQITDVSPISSLVNLANLSLDQNQVADISPLLPLVNLVELSLWQNQVTDISALSPLVNLVVLNLGENQTGDISALESLTNLRILNLNGNRITDIAPLVRNPGLGEGDWVDVSGNPLNADSVSQYLPELKSRGVNW